MCKKAHKWEETWHFRHLGKKRSLHGHHGDRGFSKSSEGRHLVDMATESLQMNQVRSPLGVAMVTYFNQGMVAI